MKNKKTNNVGFYGPKNDKKKLKPRAFKLSITILFLKSEGGEICTLNLQGKQNSLKVAHKSKFF